jgi:hypothetical protein
MHIRHILSSNVNGIGRIGNTRIENRSPVFCDSIPEYPPPSRSVLPRLDVSQRKAPERNNIPCP